MKKKQFSKKGFTLVEIMIVVAIIGILAAIAIPNFIRYRKTAQMNACIGNLKQIQSAMEQVKLAGKSGDGEVFGDDKYIKVKPTCPGKAAAAYTLNWDADGADAPVECENNPGGDYPHELPDYKAAANP